MEGKVSSLDSPSFYIYSHYFGYVYTDSTRLDLTCRFAGLHNLALLFFALLYVDLPV